MREKSKKPKKEKYVDDGKTIVNMNVEGMPWYVKGDEDRAKGQDAADHDQLTKEQYKLYKHAALRAGLLLVLVFGGVFFLFLLFCDFVWFR